MLSARSQPFCSGLSLLRNPKWNDLARPLTLITQGLTYPIVQQPMASKTISGASRFEQSFLYGILADRKMHLLCWASKKTMWICQALWHRLGVLDNLYENIIIAYLVHCIAFICECCMTGCAKINIWWVFPKVIHVHILYQTLCSYLVFHVP